MQGKGANDMTASIVEPQLNACWSVSNQSSPKIFFLSSRGFGTTLPAERSALGNLRFHYWSGIRLNLGNHGLNRARILPKNRVSVLGTSYPSCQTARQLDNIAGWGFVHCNFLGEGVCANSSAA